jgi:transcriptional regulator with XRE-family HTH domain
MNKYELSLGDMIRSYRIKKKMKQAQLAHYLGCNTVFISLMENGKSRIPVRTLGMLIEYLGLPKRKTINLLRSAHICELNRELNLGSNIAQSIADS